MPCSSLSLCGHFYFIKEMKKLVLRALPDYTHTSEFLRTLEKSENHPPSARASLHFSCVLKNSSALGKLFYFFNKVKCIIVCLGM